MLRPPSAAAVPPGTQTPTPADAATAAWARRDEPAALDQALVLWRQALQAQPHSVAILLHLAEAQAYLGDVRAAAGEPALTAWQAGADAAELALSTLDDARSAAALFWFGVNTYKLAWAQGLASALRHNETITQALRQSSAQDSGFYFGAAQSFLASHLCRLPPGLGGDLAQAERLFRAAQAQAPQFFRTRVMFASDWALRAQQTQIFASALRAVVGEQNDVLPQHLPEQRLAQREAAFLLGAQTAAWDLVGPHE